MKIKEITELADKDLREKLAQSEAAYKQLKLNHQISPLENPSQIKAARRYCTHEDSASRKGT